VGAAAPLAPLTRRLPGRPVTLPACAAPRPPSPPAAAPSACPACRAVKALRAVHARFYMDALPIGVGLVGPGLIGSTFLQQVAEQVRSPALGGEGGLACAPPPRHVLGSPGPALQAAALAIATLSPHLTPRQPRTPPSTPLAPPAAAGCAAGRVLHGHPAAGHRLLLPHAAQRVRAGPGGLARRLRRQGGGPLAGAHLGRAAAAGRGGAGRAGCQRTRAVSVEGWGAGSIRVCSPPRGPSQSLLPWSALGRHTQIYTGAHRSTPTHTRARTPLPLACSPRRWTWLASATTWPAATSPTPSSSTAQPAVGGWGACGRWRGGSSCGRWHAGLRALPRRSSAGTPAVAEAAPRTRSGRPLLSPPPLQTSPPSATWSGCARAPTSSPPTRR
jgi:hypothetical protein